MPLCVHITSVGAGDPTPIHMSPSQNDTGRGGDSVILIGFAHLFGIYGALKKRGGYPAVETIPLILVARRGIMIVRHCISSRTANHIYVGILNSPNVSENAFGCTTNACPIRFP